MIAMLSIFFVAQGNTKQMKNFKDPLEVQTFYPVTKATALQKQMSPVGVCSESCQKSIAIHVNVIFTA